MYSREEAALAASAWIRASEHPQPWRTEVAGSNSFTIALSREAGARGTEVAREVGRRLNWPVYDNELLEQLAKELHVDVRRLENVDERPGSRLVECLEAFASATNVSEMTYLRQLLKLLLSLGARGECVIVGRGAVIALPVPTTLRVRLVATREDRIAAVGRERGLKPAEAGRFVDSTDQERRRFVKDHFHKDTSDPLLYDLILNASRLTVEECAGLVVEALMRLRARPPQG